MEYYQYSEKNDNVTPSLVSYSQLPEGVKQHVFVTHDKSTFYANDYQKYAWVEDGESYCLPKSESRSIMIFGFQCPCHGTMREYVRDQYKTLQVVFYPGAQYEGYWKSSHMCVQLTDIIPLFNAIHPNAVAVFLFDQGSHHKTYPEDALLAQNMNLCAIEVKDSDSGQGKFRDSSFYVRKQYDYAEHNEEKLKEYEVIESWLYKNKKYKKYFIGLCGILQQRSMYINEAERYSLKSSCNNVMTADSRCCAIYIMERQPDFANQKSALKEIVEGSGHKFELYPKYHCECNWIKRYWGAAKKEAQRECDYSFQSLNRKINSFLDSVCLPEDDVPEKIRRYFHKSFAYINAYSLGHDTEHAFEIVKQFSKLHKSHYKLRLNQ
ncbi:hypothetical protein PHYBLDRAFT_169916 [Phycomyces blakesleeanus NRRL 1555(-)]|uniref:DDE-1 domain-containing protein n=1 Tax=Phycomyces blakesleeanus (strain ATCC 8743b / DSM 1359 / FGSC 10004 / NBRC 33097 / NRRL 1555) TaxID=763407 RepID=A0A162N865_PHYB8|nr:hypothetical protein PHYBLDRAFT_169916 [Phycomyces blakesleeanus NRRL 1555(-)]OAD72008.1 hypothetical protein PHYBLDRAFT_169916 [Phycomyces blakesleeanus NRRL 1555(-)]|eukprot:XP_018290048.1 hypothetical protein PHYBLDRAFT_169916 [Phycomyces blakesleeanus NRRL 1555(-)]